MATLTGGWRSLLLDIALTVGIYSIALLNPGAMAPLLSIPPAHADSSLANVTRRGHLRVGIDASVGGAYMFWNPKTQYYDGFEWEIAQKIAEKLNVELRPINIPWNGQPEQLAARQIDLILSAREQGGLDGGRYKDRFVETAPYYISSQRILVRKDSSKISTLRNLIGKRVGVVANSGGAAVIETYNKNRGNAIRVFSSRDLNRVLAKLRDRQLDAMLLDEPVAMWQITNNSSFTVVGEPFLPIGLVAILNKDDRSLYKEVDRAIYQIKQEGTLEAILRRWKLWDSQKSLESVGGSPVIRSTIIMLFWA
ncbi:substrate-binding periplasmic protein [Pseudanabaena sp. PCC 6802]|uniref:substrate-binding periplasmic protein n=1 Tax=Pseudanabaena sp. PCC 6802 TaxID=118173 RepID=UPI00034A154A|nr:ABC transporter substrate-binding protein [Pseudanabaena sp. PCC 6802]